MKPLMIFVAMLLACLAGCGSDPGGVTTGGEITDQMRAEMEAAQQKVDAEERAHRNQ